MFKSQQSELNKVFANISNVKLYINGQSSHLIVAVPFAQQRKTINITAFSFARDSPPFESFALRGDWLILPY